MSLFLHLHSSQASYVMKHAEEMTQASVATGSLQVHQILDKGKGDQDMSKVTSLLSKQKFIKSTSFLDRQLKQQDGRH